MHNSMIRNILQLNYYLALLISLACAILSLVSNEFPFHNNIELYGPLARNLKLMLAYLFLTELSVFSFCSLTGNYKALTVLGLFLILLIGALEFYGTINNIPIDKNYYVFFLYTGISHILFGTLSFIKNTS